MSIGARRASCAIVRNVLCTVNSKVIHRSYTDDRVRVSRVHVKLTKARSYTGATPECKGVLLCMDV